MRRVLWLLMLAACDRVFGTDLPVIVRPFGEPIWIEELSSPFSDQDPTLTPDLLEIVYVTDRTDGAIGRSDLWTSSRATIDEPFAPPVPMPTPLSSPEGDQHPHFTAGGNVLYFSSDRTGEWEIYRTERSGRGATWSEPAIVVELGAPGNDQMGSTSEDELVAVIASARDVADSRRDLYLLSRRTTDDPWADIVRLTDTNTPEGSPFLTSNATALYFTRTEDIYRANLVGTGIDTKIDDDGVVEELSTAATSETDPWLLDDESVIVFCRVRDSAALDLYIAQRLAE